MPTEEELTAQLDEQVQRNQELQQRLTDAEFGQEDLTKLQAEKVASDERAATLQGQIDGFKKDKAVATFKTKRDTMLKELKIEATHPAVGLAFPEGVLLNDEDFAAHQITLKAIVDEGKPSGDDPPADDPAVAAFRDAKIPASEGGVDGTEGREDRNKAGHAARMRYAETGNLRDLIASVKASPVKQLLSRKTPGGIPYIEIKEVS